MVKTFLQKTSLYFFIGFLYLQTHAQTPQVKAKSWADSVLASLTKDQRIAQLMIVRAHSNLV